MKARWPKLCRYESKPYKQHIYLARTRKEYRQAHHYISKNKCHDLNIGNGLLTFHENKNGGTILLMGWFNKDIEVLTHECSHAVWKIFGMCGVYCTKDNDEAFAYLLGDMVKHFWRKR